MYHTDRVLLVRVQCSSRTIIYIFLIPYRIVLHTTAAAVVFKYYVPVRSETDETAMMRDRSNKKPPIHIW